MNEKQQNIETHDYRVQNKNFDTDIVIAGIMGDREIPITTSLKVAEIFNKSHKDVLRKIDLLLEDLRPYYSSAQNCAEFIESEYYDSSGKRNLMYKMNRDGFSLLAMGFTGKKALRWKIKYIEAFNAMETALRQHALYGSTLTLEDFAAAKAKVELVDSIIGEEACLGIRETAHRFGVTQMELVNFLSEEGYIVRSNISGIWVPSAEHKDSGWFKVVHRVRMCQITPRPQTYITREGREKLYLLITKAQLAGRLSKNNAREARGKENHG